jgi:hypothetical protein
MATRAAPLCCIRLGGPAPQLSQVAAGFTLLGQKGLLRLRYEGTADFRGEGLYGHGVILEARLGGAVLAYDLADGCEAPSDKDEFGRQLERVAFYFKRNYDPDLYQGLKHRRKLRPLGLNYRVTCPGSFLDARAPSPEDYMSHNSYPSYRGLFLTRLWDPGAPGLGEQAAADLERVNALRIGCVRACREALGERFSGGVEASPYAQKAAPDLVLPAAETNRSAYLRRLQGNYACVAAGGPRHCVGREMAEYCAAGRAIVTETLRVLLPGGFSRGRNCILYATPEECARQLASLLGNVPGIHRMEAANFAYYNDYVRPDALVLRTLREAWPQFPKDFA